MSPNPKETPPYQVTAFHRRSDVDGSRTSQHHTLGAQKEQAAAGNHDHRGGDSTSLLGGNVISGSRSGGAALASVIAILVELGATDSTIA